MPRAAFWTGLLTIMAVLCWISGIVLFGFLQQNSACWMFVASGLCLVYPTKLALTPFDEDES